MLRRTLREIRGGAGILSESRVRLFLDCLLLNSLMSHSLCADRAARLRLLFFLKLLCIRSAADTFLGLDGIC